jgi:hypothetical protein
VIPEILLLIEQIRPRTTKIDNLWATVSIFFQTLALEAVKGVGDALWGKGKSSVKRGRCDGG